MVVRLWKQKGRCSVVPTLHGARTVTREEDSRVDVNELVPDVERTSVVQIDNMFGKRHADDGVPRS